MRNALSEHGMTSSTVESRAAHAAKVTLSREALTVDLTDGRSITVPLAWYPRLAHATAAERRNWRFIGAGHGIHWPDLDEDVAVAGLLAGLPSGESQDSLGRWLESRKRSRGRAGAARSKHA